MKTLNLNTNPKKQIKSLLVVSGIVIIGYSICLNSLIKFYVPMIYQLSLLHMKPPILNLISFDISISNRVIDANLYLVILRYYIIRRFIMYHAS